MARGKPDVTTMRLMQKRKDPKQKRHKQSSLKDNNLVAVAAAVELGLVEMSGLPALLHAMHQKRLRKVLASNFVTEVKPKSSTVKRDHVFTQERQEACRALNSGLLGRLYMEAMQGKPLWWTLNKGRITTWLCGELGNPKSQLNETLRAEGYEHLPGLKRSPRWWGDQL